jgi:histidine triad (HIT) family protein
MLKTIFFKIARSRVSSFFIGFAFERLSALMPLERHYQDSHVIVFAHPAPAWPLHLLAVPKKHISSFMRLALDAPRDQQVVLSIFQAIQTVASRKELSDFCVLVNGGAYQDVPQIHFHLVSGRVKGASQPGAGLYAPQDAQLDTTPPARTESFPPGNVLTSPHPNPARQFHYVIMAAKVIPGLTRLDFADADHTGSLLELLRAAQAVIVGHALSAYTLVLNSSETGPDHRLTFHILAGPRV